MPDVRQGTRHVLRSIQYRRRVLRRRVFEQSRSFESLLCFAQFGACGPSCLRIEEGDARQAGRSLLLLFVPYQQLADRDRRAGHCGVGRHRRRRLRSVHLAQGQHDPEAVLGHLDGVQPRYGRQLHQRRCRGYAQSDHRQGLVHGLRTRSAEEYQRQGGQECLAQYFRQPAEQGSRNSLRFAAQGAGALLQVRRHHAL